VSRIMAAHGGCGFLGRHWFRHVSLHRVFRLWRECFVGRCKDLLASLVQGHWLSSAM
jgi:hypothetical protein